MLFFIDYCKKWAKKQPEMMIAESAYLFWRRSDTGALGQVHGFFEKSKVA